MCVVEPKIKWERVCFPIEEFLTTQHTDSSKLFKLCNVVQKNINAAGKEKNFDIARTRISKSDPILIPNMRYSRLFLIKN